MSLSSVHSLLKSLLNESIAGSVIDKETSLLVSEDLDWLQSLPSFPFFPPKIDYSVAQVNLTFSFSFSPFFLIQFPLPNLLLFKKVEYIVKVFPFLINQQIRNKSQKIIEQIQTNLEKLQRIANTTQRNSEVEKWLLFIQQKTTDFLSSCGCSFEFLSMDFSRNTELMSQGAETMKVLQRLISTKKSPELLILVKNISDEIAKMIQKFQKDVSFVIDCEWKRLPLCKQVVQTPEQHLLIEQDKLILDAILEMLKDNPQRKAPPRANATPRVGSLQSSIEEIVLCYLHFYILVLEAEMAENHDGDEGWHSPKGVSSKKGRGIDYRFSKRDREREDAMAEMARRAEQKRRVIEKMHKKNMVGVSPPCLELFLLQHPISKKPFVCPRTFSKSLCFSHVVAKYVFGEERKNFSEKFISKFFKGSFLL